MVPVRSPMHDAPIKSVPDPIPSELRRRAGRAYERSAVDPGRGYCDTRVSMGPEGQTDLIAFVASRWVTAD